MTRGPQSVREWQVDVPTAPPEPSGGAAPQSTNPAATATPIRRTISGHDNGHRTRTSIVFLGGENFHHDLARTYSSPPTSVRVHREEVGHPEA